MIELRNLSKHFGPLKAVDNVSLTIQRGEVLGFLGPNGAGKSTTMKMVTGFLSPTGGTAVVCGKDVAKEPQAVKAAIGYLPEGAPLYPDMTPRTFLEFVAEVRGLSGAKRDERIATVVKEVHLERVLHQRMETLSKGFKRRVGIAQAILHDPEVLILDEPTDGLDPNQKHEVRQLIRRMAQDKVIVLSTHILEEVEAVCTRAVIIARGKLCFDGTPQELRARSPRHNAVALTFRGEAPGDAVEKLTSLSGIGGVESDAPASYLVMPAGDEPIVDAVSRCARDEQWEIDQIFVQQGSLDEVFRNITTDETVGVS